VSFVEQRHPSLEQALALLEGVRGEAEERSLALAACVVDAGGALVGALVGAPGARGGTADEDEACVLAAIAAAGFADA